MAPPHGVGKDLGPVLAAPHASRRWEGSRPRPGRAPRLTALGLYGGRKSTGDMARDDGARGCPCHGAGVAAERSHGWRSEGGIERAKAWKAEASVRRRGMGSPERRGGASVPPSLTRLGFRSSGQASGDGHGQPAAGVPRLTALRLDCQEAARSVGRARSSPASPGSRATPTDHPAGPDRHEPRDARPPCT